MVFVKIDVEGIPGHNLAILAGINLTSLLLSVGFWKSESNAKAYPGADISLDHNPVVATLRIKLKKVLKAEKEISLECRKAERQHNGHGISS